MPTDITPPTERRRSVLSAVSTSRFYIIAAIGLSMVTVAAVLVVVALQPPNYMQVIQVIVGITAQLILALLGAGGIGVLKVIDGHQSQLMAAIAEKERAKGQLEGLRENPKTNIE